jgi:hypothetical protein
MKRGVSSAQGTTQLLQMRLERGVAHESAPHEALSAALVS